MYNKHVAIGLGIFVALIAIFVFGLRLLAEFFSVMLEGARQLEPSVYVPLGVTIITAAIGLFVTLFTQAKLRQREIESAHRERKLELYLEFMKIVEDLLISVKPDIIERKLDNKDLTLRLIRFRTRAILWGSPRLLKHLSELTTHSRPGDLIRVMGNIQREMRRDLGLSNWGLDQDFFTTIYLKDKSEISNFEAS